MSKQSGLGDNFYLGGYDLSGDTSALGEIGGGIATLDVTGIDKSAMERIGGLRDGRIEWVSFFNPATARAHPALSSLPTADRHLAYFRGTGLGSPAACMIGKQLNYDPTRADDGALTIAVRAEANGYGLEWGNQLTAGKRTDTSATNGSGVALAAEGYLSLSGSSGDYASTPDAAGLDITGDIDIRARVALDDWTPAAESTIIAKYTATSDERSYALGVTTGGNLIMRWTADGSTELSETSSVAVSITNGQPIWVRATLDVDNGASDAEVKFYTSTDGSTWTQLGTTQLVGATTSIFVSTAVLEIGSRDAGTTARMAGKFFQGSVLSGIGGTAVAAPVATTSSITDATPLTWTVQGSAYLSEASFFGAQFYLQVFEFTGTDVTIKIQQSSDNGSADAYADVTGGGFTVVSAAPGAQRIATTATLPIERYLRVVTTTSGGFTNLVFAVVAVRNLTATVF